MSLKQQADARLENQLTRALEREDELISKTGAPTEGEPSAEVKVSEHADEQMASDPPP